MYKKQNSETLVLVASQTRKPTSQCRCGSTQVKGVLSGNSTHYGKWNCSNCDRFRRWIENPQTATRRASENQIIDRLLATGHLNDWEIQFCQSIRDRKKRSPKQKEKLQKIAERL